MVSDPPFGLWGHLVFGCTLGRQAEVTLKLSSRMSMAKFRDPSLQHLCRGNSNIDEHLQAIPFETIREC